jgi:hypothetical protein|nr:hypothetical protein [uncultured Acetatifactor sp.]
MEGRPGKEKLGYIGTVVVATAIFLGLSMDAVASENMAVPSGTTGGDSAVCSDVESGYAGKLPAETRAREDILSVELPVIAEGEPSPFDFILDPWGLLYETSAIRYGGGAVEESATMLFHNKEREYDFSRYSDKLSIANPSGIPVIVTVSGNRQGENQRLSPRSPPKNRLWENQRQWNHRCRRQNLLDYQDKSREQNQRKHSEKSQSFAFPSPN